MKRRILLTAFAVLTVAVSRADAQSIFTAPSSHTPWDMVVIIGSQNTENDCRVRLNNGEIEVELNYVDPQTGDSEEISDEFPDPVELVVFVGGDKSDVFEIDDPEEITDANHPLWCILCGMGGIDALAGGPNNDYISGNNNTPPDVPLEYTNSNDAEVDLLMGGGGNDTFVRSFVWRWKKVGNPNIPGGTSVEKYKEYEDEEIVDLSLGDQFIDLEVDEDDWVEPFDPSQFWHHWSTKLDKSRTQRR